MNKRTPDAIDKRTPDALVLMLLMALTALFAWRFVNFSIPPFEDAAMLMRYSDHLAHGKGIVWNIGDAPVDGATDFLFMVVVALVRCIGLSLEATVRVITILSHFCAVALVYLGMRRLQHSGVIPACLSAAYVAVGPGLFLSAAYFGTPFFALAVAIAWLSAQRLMSPDGRTTPGCLLFSLSCLTVGLIRPEGVLISFFMLTAVSVMVPLRELRRITIVFGAIFLVFGGAYVIWRWHYFGYPLPNPFYKKGGGHLYITGLADSVQNSYNLLYPLIPAFLLSIRRSSTLRMAIAFLVPIAGSVAMWVLLSNEMNFGGRFQYPIFLIGILSWFPLVRTLGDDLRLPKFASLTGRQKLAVALVALSVLGLVFRRQIKNSVSITYVKDGRYDMAVMLSDYADRDYMIATTEAGLLPLYSGWRAIDTWGLNDKWIAHHGLITEGYLNQRHPDIIMWHGHFSPLYPQSPEISATPWGRQILALKSYAEHNHFTLAAVFGISPENTHYYYVRSDLPEHDEIVERIRSMHYVWYENGSECENYAVR